MKEIALFGGTFDPPTKAHEAIVASCLNQPGIDEVWWMPSGHRSDKPNMLDNTTRLNMLNLINAAVFENNPRLVVTDFEQNLPQPTQTYETAKALSKEYPDNKFWFVFGADAYNDMRNWEHGQELRRHLGMLVVPRMHITLPEQNEHLHYLDTKESDVVISSTDVRQNLILGQSVNGLLDANVADYITSHDLYKQLSGARI
jgi:nicotinate-nucleotide adenylyltransferase